MNCDQVFSILTRGPFPSGDTTDAAVEAHLSHCSECRHFAEALRPDGSTDAESLIAEESRGLPYYWGLAASSGQHAGQLTATEDRRRTRRRRKPTFFERHEPLAHLSGWQLVFAVLMGALLGTLLRMLGYADGGSEQKEVAASALAMAAVDSRLVGQPNHEQELTAKLGTMPLCCERRLSGFDAQPASDGTISLTAQTTFNERCCTACHNASSERFTFRATTSKIVRSCQVCHKEAVASRFEPR